MKRTLFLLSVAFALAALALVTRGAAGARPPAVVEILDSPTGPGASVPNLAVAPSGHVYMSWIEPAADSAHALRVASFDGRAWSPARTVRQGPDFFVNWADFPSVAVLADGQLAAHWLQRTGRGTYAYGVRVSQSRDGGATWSAPLIPHRDTSQTEHGFVALWRESPSVLGAAWLDGRKFHVDGHSPSNEMMLIMTTVSAEGVLGPETPLDDRVCDCCQTSAAITSGGPVLVYRDRSAEEIRDISIVRRVNGRWTAPAPVHRDGWRIAACPVNGPAVAAVGRNVVVAWFTAANESPRVYVAFSTDAGATFGRPVRIDGGTPSGRVDVVYLGDGSALVSWIERTGGEDAVVRARRVVRGRAPGAPVTIATSSAARASGFPRMAVSGDQVYFAWTVAGRPSHVRVARMAQRELR